jgi:hypothetical protein
MAPTAPIKCDTDTRCPKCLDGTGHLRGIRSEGALNILTYVCGTCAHRWQGSERWMDPFGFVRWSEPQRPRGERPGGE